DGVDLVVAEGEVRGLLGPNGAGKTTLLRLLLGLIRPDAGTAELLGRELDATGSMVGDGVAGFVEEPSFYPYLSGRANLELLAELDGDGARSPRSRATDGLQRVGLAQRGDDRVNGYSSAMRQRLGIAASLLRSPRLLLLDEPTSGLDPAGARDVARLIRSLAGEGAAVLLSSHLLNDFEEVCDSFTVLRDGRVVWDGTAAQLRAQAPVGAYGLATSHDDRALAFAAGQRGVRAEPSPGGGLAVFASEAALDRYVATLVRADIAIRRLVRQSSPLQSMFFALTDETAPEHVERLPD
ncbi:MAG: ABC transporter ATP-binding protein, partial [Solirubrobacteraceae bacterium]